MAIDHNVMRKTWEKVVVRSCSLIIYCFAGSFSYVAHALIRNKQLGDDSPPNGDDGYLVRLLLYRQTKSSPLTT